MNRKLTANEKLAYGFAGLGQNMVYALSLFFLMYFYNYVFEVKAMVVGAVFLVARIWMKVMIL